MCNIQEEISRLNNAGSRAEDAEFSQYQAAKFQGEILNMKQENNKVCDELKAGFERVRQMKVGIKGQEALKGHIHVLLHQSSISTAQTIQLYSSITRTPRIDTTKRLSVVLIPHAA
ncbi:hypothetical protein SLEP1_g30081 [Rubroshorea leprosula]|uniref:NET2A-D/KIP1-like C-terminal domain-containing protein n=1 Tax=Rubroshorea leprosula TaxID=152421 RepID=A0AAV5K7L6_9ROSI|nr:hypothetical protein SLEP1_g30081 [Rubroshorea leprosula]